MNGQYWRRYVKRIVPLLLCAAVLACAAQPGECKTVRSYYFGNSLTAGTTPEFHDELAAACGDTWQAQMFGIAGGRLQQYVDLLFPDYPDMAHPKPDGDRSKSNALKARQAIENGQWDAVVIQPHQAHLKWVPSWVRPPREIGDIAEGGKLVAWLRSHQPAARLYLYQTWAVPTYFDNNQEKPDFATFDYERFWLRPYADPAPENDPHPTRIMRTRDYHWRLLNTLNENHADILGDQPIRMIPTGDVMLELHRRLAAGTFTDAGGKPFVLTRRTVIVDNEKDRNFVDLTVEQIPFTDISVFYQDFQHQNPGLPRFFDAAVFYAVLFGKEPRGLDYAPYNVFPSRNADGTFDMSSNYIWRPNDNRKFILITPEVADALTELVWDVVSSHPHTGVRP
jgi:hypothetical protein